MDRFLSDLRRKSAAMIEDDGSYDEKFYEEIEAPHFVDFTVPDRSRPDDESWFCLRIGCDQMHEVVDPEALHKSFILRVMAARSPNVRLKALKKKASSSTPKCPNSAPPKPAKERVMRLSRITSIPEKMASGKLKEHQISNLRSTPKTGNRRLQPATIEKSLTTPRVRRTPAIQEAFLSVKHQKVQVVTPKKTTVAKALFQQTPKEGGRSKGTNPTGDTPMSDACAQMRKLKIASATKHKPKRHVSNSSRRATCGPNHPEAAAKDPKSKGHEWYTTEKQKNEDCPEALIIGSVLKDVTIDTDKETKISVQENRKAKCSTVGSVMGVEPPQSSMVSADESSLQPAAKENTSFVDSETTDNSKGGAAYSDENKENAPDTQSTRDYTHSESEASHFSENVPEKGIGVLKKVLNEKPGHGKKHKKIKPTNPKPFRLRTDERGILREANLERRLQIASQKQGERVVRQGDEIQLRTRTAFMNVVTVAEEKLATKNLENNMKGTEKPQKMMLGSSQLAKAQCTIAARKGLVCQLGTGMITNIQTEGKANGNTTTTSTVPRGKKPSTIPKEPSFHKVHLPKSCTKRPYMRVPGFG